MRGNKSFGKWQLVPECHHSHSSLYCILFPAQQILTVVLFQNNCKNTVQEGEEIVTAYSGAAVYFKHWEVSVDRYWQKVWYNIWGFCLFKSIDLL